jgi:hypothetical protein
MSTSLLVIVVGFITSMVTGFILSHIVYLNIYKNGTFDINTTDPEKDIYRLNIDNFDKLERRRFLLLKIDKK